MALKVLILQRSLSDKRKALEALRTASADFETREKDLEVSISEADTADEKVLVQQAVDVFEGEKAENEKTASALEAEITGIEKEIDDIERAAPALAPVSAAAPVVAEEKRENMKIDNRMKYRNMTMEQRTAFVAREDVHEFAVRVRELAQQKRGITGAELTIPDNVLELMRLEAYDGSKLMQYLNKKSVKGTSRQNIIGEIPEAIWTEAVGALNELAVVFNQVECDGYKVGGFVAIPNSTLEDSDIDLMGEMISIIGHSIGIGIDKAVLYGTGVKMPMGIVTRLAQTVKPAGAPAAARAWEDLHLTHLLKVDGALVDATFFASLVLVASTAESKNSTGAKFWAMNERTKAKLMSKALTFNAAGAIVASVNNKLPVIDGDIVELDFIPDGDIIGGYGEKYLLAEREGGKIATSEHAQFIADNTVVKGVARYDGKPVIAESFVAFNINNAAVTTVVAFSPDTAKVAQAPAAPVGPAGK